MFERDVVALLAVIAVIGFAHAMTVTATTMPPVLAPGTSGKIVITLTPAGPVTGVEFKISDSTKFSIENAGDWVSLGDSDGTPITYVLGISVPEDVSPGTYAVPIEVDYRDSTGNARHLSTYFFVGVASGGVEVSLPDHVYGGKIQDIDVSITNRGPAISNAYMAIPGTVGAAETYVGTIPANGSKTVRVKILPICRNGVYETNIMIRGFTDNNAVAMTIPYAVRCYPPNNDITVDMNMPETTSGGEHNTVLTIRNNLDVAVGPLTVTITGKNIDLGGQTGYSFAAIQPGQTVSIPISWKLQQDDLPGAITVSIYESNYPRTYTFSTMPDTRAEIRVYTTGEPKWTANGLEISVTVANVGTGTAKTVFVSAEGNNIVSGNTVIGDLAPGDYDTAKIDFKPSGKETRIHLMVTYFENGKEVQITKDIFVQTPPKSEGAWIWAVIAVAAIAGVWWWRKRK